MGALGAAVVVRSGAESGSAAVAVLVAGVAVWLTRRMPSGSAFLCLCTLCRIPSRRCSVLCARRPRRMPIGSLRLCESAAVAMAGVAMIVLAVSPLEAVMERPAVAAMSVVVAEVTAVAAIARVARAAEVVAVVAFVGEVAVWPTRRVPSGTACLCLWIL